MNGRANNSRFRVKMVSYSAIVFNGLALILAFWPSWQYGFWSIVICLPCVGIMDRVYYHINFGYRDNDCRIGYQYWCILPFCIPPMSILGLLGGESYVTSFVVLPTMTCLVVTIYNYSLYNIASLIVLWTHDNVWAVLYGVRYSNAYLANLEDDNHARRMYKQEYVAYEPVYTDFKPPLDWWFFCEQCGARKPNNTERCWYCNGYGRDYHDHMNS